MSTEIKTIKGRYESYHMGYKAVYSEATIFITRFAGGENGAMIQLTVQSGTISYIQLTKKQVKDLVETLNDSFDYSKYPSE